MLLTQLELSIKGKSVVFLCKYYSSNACY